MKHTNETVDEFLKNKNIQRLEEYKALTKPITFKCNNCNLIWKSGFGALYHYNRGCSRCSNKEKLSKEKLIKHLKTIDLKLISEFNLIECEFLCNICNEIFSLSPRLILLRKIGCKCKFKRNKTESSFLINLKDKNLSTQDAYINNNTKLNITCNKCSYCWMTKPRTLLTASCPMCNRFKKNEKLIFQILKDNHIDFKYDYHINKIVKDDSKFRIDFLINNTIIEYNGKQHYQPSIFNKETKEQSVLNFQKQVKRDEYIKEFCNKNNIELIVIDGRKFFNKRLINYIENVVLPILKNCI